VFLHHPEFVCDLPQSSRINLYGLDNQSTISGLPGISERLLAPAQRPPISEEGSLLVAELMKKIGRAPRRQREVGSWIIDEQPLADGEGWQDWPAFHHVDTERHARIRFYTVGQSASSADSHARQQALTSEFHLLSRLRDDGLRTPEDLVEEPELGIGLVFPQPKCDGPLDLWLAAPAGPAPCLRPGLPGSADADDGDPPRPRRHVTSHANNVDPWEATGLKLAMTWPWNLLNRYPVIEVPLGVVEEGMPSGMRVIGQTFADLDTFQFASTWSRIMPPLFAHGRFPTVA
jgi:hypothetical protein